MNKVDKKVKDYLYKAKKVFEEILKKARVDVDDIKLGDGLIVLVLIAKMIQLEESNENKDL